MKRIMRSAVLCPYSSRSCSPNPYSPISIRSIYIIIIPYGRFLTSSEQSYSYLDSYYDTGWYTLCQQKTLEYRPWSAVRELKRYSFEKVPVRVLTIFIPIKSSSSAQTSDYAIVNLNASYMETIIENTLPSADEGQMFAIMNENGEIVLHSPGLTLTDREISRQLLAVNGLIRLKIGRKTACSDLCPFSAKWMDILYLHSSKCIFSCSCTHALPDPALCFPDDCN